MQTKWITEKIKYDGSQLRSLYNYLEYQILGDSLIAWQGPCEVSLQNMVDGEDKLAKSVISGSEMIHFICEVFAQPLPFAVSIQRVMAAIVRDTMQELAGVNQVFIRDGDDIYFEKKKLSISIATVSPVSALIHFAVNVSNVGTPVPTCSLQDFSIDSQIFAKTVLHKFSLEMVSIKEATQKVHWVR